MHCKRSKSSLTTLGIALLVLTTVWAVGNPEVGKGANAQDNWRECTKCEGLFFAGNNSRGVCPAGGGHRRASIGNVPKWARLEYRNH